MVEDVQLKTIYKELKTIKDELNRIGSKIEIIELASIPEEEISKEDAEELDGSVIEVKENGIEWDDLKPRLDL